MQGLSLVAASGGHSSSQCMGLSPSRPLLLRSTGSRHAGSAVVAHGPSCSVACGIFPDQGSNPRPLHWQADSQPLHHQGSPRHLFLLQKERHFHSWSTCARNVLTASSVVLWRWFCSLSDCFSAEVYYPSWKGYKINMYDILKFHHPESTVMFLCISF